MLIRTCFRPHVLKRLMFTHLLEWSAPRCPRNRGQGCTVPLLAAIAACISDWRVPPVRWPHPTWLRSASTTLAETRGAGERLFPQRVSNLSNYLLGQGALSNKMTTRTDILSH